MTIDTLATWHEIAASGNVQGLDAFLAEDVVFHSPILHTPRFGKEPATKYLAAAFQVFFDKNPNTLERSSAQDRQCWSFK